MPVKCFLLEPTQFSRRSLRCYAPSDSNKPCPGRLGFHNARVILDQVAADGPDDVGRPPTASELVTLPWPTKCDACDYLFTEDDETDIDSDTLWKRSDSGEMVTIKEAGPGAMWDATWFNGNPEWTGPDGKAITVICPNGATWVIDGRCYNCDSPCRKCGRPYHAHYNNNDPSHCAFEESRPHKCWVRHGEPPMLTVDKNGVTCGAGGGSIQAGDYHGFLRNGVFDP